MKISFSFFKQLLELLTSDWRSYLDKVIEGYENLALTDTNDKFIALIKEGEYPWYVAPFNKIDHASLLLTNIHILELDYLNQNTVKAVKNMLRNNFKDIYNPEIYISANYEDHTNESLKHLCIPLNKIKILDIKLVAELSNIIKFIHQFYFVNSIITHSTILDMATHFNSSEDFYKNLHKLNFMAPLQKYNSNCQPEDYNSFIDIEAITWNRFLVKYQKLFNNLSEKHSEILSSICSDNKNFVKLLISDSCHLSLNKRNEIIKYLIDKYQEDVKSIYPTALKLFNLCDDKYGLVKLLLSDSYDLSLEKRIEIVEYLIGKYKNDTKSIYYITEQLFNICTDNTTTKTIEIDTERFHKWDGLPPYWYTDFKGLPGCDTKALIIGNSATPENDYI